MKKIKLIMATLIFMMLVTTLDIKAETNIDVEKPLVLLKGDKNVDINYEGYRLVSSNLNIDVVGEYTSLYQNKATSEIITKYIYVVDKNSVFKNTYCIDVNTKIYDENRKIELIEKADKKNSYYILCSQEVESEDADSVNLYLLYIADGILQYEKLIIENKRASVVDLKIDQNKIIIVCNVFFKYSGLDLYIGTYDLNGNLLIPKYYGGTDYDAGEAIVILSDFYYIAGSTKSVKGEIGGTRDNMDSFIMKLNKETLKIENVYYYNLKDENNCQKAIVVDEYIYTVEKYKENNLRKLRILKIDQNGNTIGNVNFDAAINVDAIQLLAWDGTIVVVTNETTTKSISKIYMIDPNLNVHKIDEYSNDGMIIMDAYLENEELTLLYHINQKDKLCMFIRKINLMYEEETLNTLLEEDAFNYHIYNNTLYKIVNNEIYKPTFNYLRVDKFGTNIVKDENTNINDYQIIMNGNKTKLNSNNSTLKYDLNLFGNYEGIYYFSNTFFDFRYTQNIKVLSNPSIINNDIHDKNLVLTFNALGILNGKPIESGYVIKDEGEYILKLVGKDNISVEYKFEVKSQSLKLIDIDNSQTNETKIINVKEKIDNITNKETILTIEYDSKNTTHKLTSTTWWPLFIPVFLGSLSIIIIIKGGIR